VAERRRRRRRRKTSALSLHGIDDREERLHPDGLRHLPPRAHLRRGLPSLRRIGGWKTVTGFWNVPTRELDGRGVGAPSKRCAPPPSSRHPEGPAPGSLCRDMRGSPVRALRRGRNEAPHTSFRLRNAKIKDPEDRIAMLVDTVSFGAFWPKENGRERDSFHSRGGGAGGGGRGAPLQRVAHSVSVTSEGLRAVPGETPRFAALRRHGWLM